MNALKPLTMNNKIKELVNIYLSGDIISSKDMKNIIKSSEVLSMQKIVMNGLSEIEYGNHVSYSEFALKIGFQKQVRYISTLIGRNPLPIIIPCHRIIRKNGDIGNYIFGSEIKQELIDFELNKIDKISNESIKAIMNYFEVNI
jgi:methylated-DNA-[protein]-cysteine S-methyltransferase